MAAEQGVCAYPGCQQRSLFDLNTGEELYFCSEHVSLSDGSMICQNVSSIPQCSLQGCSRPRYIDHQGIMFDCCSRTHGRQYLQLQLQQQQPSSGDSVVPAELKCKNPNCYRQRYPVGDGTYYDYCGTTCRDSLLLHSSALSCGASGSVCSLPGCMLAAHGDHPFCGKSHAQQAMEKVLLELDQASPEYKQVLADFRKEWVKNKPAPKPDAIFKVCNPHRDNRFSQYMSKLSDTTVERHYHGTTLKCNLTANKQACTDGSCGVCGISRHGFYPKKIGTNIPRFTRFGKGFYLAPNSSKCHDYTQGTNIHRAMLLCDVAPGNKYTLKHDSTGLSGPPQGFDSVYGLHGGSLNYDEIVLYHRHAILPKFVIVYQRDGIKKIAT